MNRDQYGQAYVKGFGRTVSVLRRAGAKTDEAFDLAQAAWVQGWERLAQLRDPDRMLPWIARIAVNRFRDEISRTRRLAELSSAATDFRFSPHVGLELIDLRRALGNAPERQQTSIRRVYLRGESVAEVAAALGISQGAVYHRLSRERHSIQQSLMPKQA
jgi:RNA polymerase sigma factor (sigma-70 family)